MMMHSRRHIGYLAVAVLSTFISTASFVIPTKSKQSKHSSMLKMATWSDSKAVKDYQEFLSSGHQEIQLRPDGPSVIVRPYDGYGDLSLAQALFSCGMGDDYVITPDQDLPDTMTDGSQEFPIYITLPPWQIQEFLMNLPPSYQAKAEDFVFFSGGLKYGNIEDVLKERGYCRDSMTQVLVSGMKISPEGRVEDVHARLGTDGNGEEKLAGECTACGKWNGSIAQRLERSNVLCKTDFYREWRRKMWERSVLDAVFNLIGSVRAEPTTVANVASYYTEEVGDMVWDLSQLLRGWRAITLMYGFEERMYGAAEKSGADEPCTLIPEMYPYIWGNSVFLESQQFVEYLHYAQSQMGLLQGVELPVRSEDSFTSKMRKGNLRADGVV